jgi:hypothetical protein
MPAGCLQTSLLGPAEPGPAPSPPTCPTACRLSSRAKGTWSEIRPENAPHAPGLYALFSGPTLLYIGSAVSIRDRLTEHGLRPRRFTIPAAWALVPRLRLKIAASRRPGDWLMREYRLIRRLRPPRNRVHGGTGRRRRNHRSDPPRRPR